MDESQRQFWRNLGGLISGGQTARALRILEQNLQQAGSSQAFHAQLMAFLDQTAALPATLDILNHLTRKYSGQSWSHFALARCLFKKSQKQAAYRAMQTASNLDPDNLDLHVAYAMMLLRGSRQDEVEPRLTRFLGRELSPRQWERIANIFVTWEETSDQRVDLSAPGSQPGPAALAVRLPPRPPSSTTISPKPAAPPFTTPSSACCRSSKGPWFTREPTRYSSGCPRASWAATR